MLRRDGPERNPATAQPTENAPISPSRMAFFSKIFYLYFGQIKVVLFWDLLWQAISKMRDIEGHVRTRRSPFGDAVVLPTFASTAYSKMYFLMPPCNFKVLMLNITSRELCVAGLGVNCDACFLRRLPGAGGTPLSAKSIYILNSVNPLVLTDLPQMPSVSRLS